MNSPLRTISQKFYSIPDLIISARRAPVRTIKLSSINQTTTDIKISPQENYSSIKTLKVLQEVKNRPNKKNKSHFALKEEKKGNN